MLKRLLPVFVLFAFCAGLRAADDDQPIRFDVLLDQYYEDYLALFPIDAAINGDNDHRYDAVWPDDLNLEHRAKVAAMCDKYLEQLERYKRARLQPSEQLSYDSLKWSLDARRAGLGQIYWMQPISQFNCPTLTFAQMASGSYLHQFNTAQDFRNFLGRAKSFSQWIDTAIANMRTGVAKGVVQPRILMERVLGQLEPLTVDDANTNILFGALKKLPANLPAPEKDKLAAEYRDGVRAIMLPAYQRLRDFIRDEYLPKCRDTAGIGAVPGGKAAYAWSVRWQTTTDLTPDQIHEIGLREVARIRGEMEKVQAQVGFKGTLNEFLNFVATDPQFAPYKTDEEVLNGYRAIEGRVMAAVPKFFRRLPHTKFEIRATEKFRAATASAEYIAGTADGSRPGVFYVPIPDVAKFRTPRMEDLFLHEAIPGHHFQLSLALENFSLPKFRRFESTNAYVEGWALYCESIGGELGMYTDPYQYLGMLLGDMHRAIRLVVDTGMHAKGWTREQALAYGAENEGGSPERQVAEIERYMAWPGQALGYKIGQLKIRELRARGEEKLGARFDLPGFHEQVLGEGALPLAVLEARIDAWLKR
ncbi:MAG TPA: DUF885 domain-containing protein [Candidatus Didemnitutus sp.]|nr:DUF885 domain-containing protein [Candidatus Didemnitutus sp.]